jgi:alpha-galactosidase
VHHTERDGDGFEYTFQGTGVSYLTEMHSSQGDVNTYVDGQLVKTVDTGLADSQALGCRSRPRMCMCGVG